MLRLCMLRLCMLRLCMLHASPPMNETLRDRVAGDLAIATNKRGFEKE
jgi:hypothetical protein